MYSISRFLVTIVTILFLQSHMVFGQQCSETEREDRIEDIIGYLSSMRYNFPTNNAEINQFCSKNQNSNKFLKDYSSRCLRNEAKTIISVFAYSNSRAIKKVCSKSSSNKSRENMIKFASCANPNKLGISKCFRQMINRFSVANSITDATKRIPYMCCCNIYMKRCVINVLENSNLPACTADAIERFSNFFESISGNIMNTFCDISEESSDRCKKLLKLPKAPVVNTNHRSPFPPLISIFQNL